MTWLRSGVRALRSLRTLRAPVSSSTPLTETVRDFLDPAAYFGVLASHDLDFFSGVPDSLLKDFCAYVHDHVDASKHVLAANEGSAVGIAAGYHMATGRIPVVYMQNSGFGNSVNPLLSLCDPKVYAIPMLLMIGWRGEPGKRDEPQHLVQGKLMTNLLTDVGIPFEVLPDYIEGAKDAVDIAVHSMKLRSSPYAFLVRRQTFEKYSSRALDAIADDTTYELTRECAIDSVIGASGAWDSIVCTTGFASRELFELRVAHKQDHSRDFLTVGSMGHASAIALGIAAAKPSRQVFCLDGDGALLMHAGNVATVGLRGCRNFKHILLNNGVHDSVGAQPTGAFSVDFPRAAAAFGYKNAFRCSTREELVAGLAKLHASEGPTLMEVRVRAGARPNLGRPTTTPQQNKAAFMRFLAD